MLCVTFLLLILRTFSICGYSFFRDDFSRAASFTTKNHYALIGYDITSQRAYDILSCAHACLGVEQCKSFNFESEPHGLCELSKESKQSLGSTSFLVYRRGFTYGEIQNVTDPVFPAPSGPVVEFQFKTLGSTGMNGPTSTSGYAGTSLDGQVTLSSGIQKWSVPKTGTYVIEAYGASGKNGTCTAGAVNCTTGMWKLGGLGAKITGSFDLNAGDELQILVGQQGRAPETIPERAGGGGGGSFVILNATPLKPLIVAGGGGGGGLGMDGHTDGDPGQSSENGTLCGGEGGNGGRVCDTKLQPSFFGLFGGAGAGYSGDGAVPRLVAAAKSFKTGGTGGYPNPSPKGEGGFGGGGAGMMHGGGGGGYSGGGIVGDKYSASAGGGGSYNGGKSQVNTPGVNKGDGKVVIKMF